MAKRLISYVVIIFILLIALVITLPNGTENSNIDQGDKVLHEKSLEWLQDNKIISGQNK